MSKAKTKRSPEQQAAWAHNGLVGACWMARKNAQRITASLTATNNAKYIAEQIVNLTYQLAEALKERR